MHKKARIILLIIITLLLFLPVNKAYAKKLEYTCEYTKFVKTPQTAYSNGQYKFIINVYSGTTDNIDITEVNLVTNNSTSMKNDAMNFLQDFNGQSHINGQNISTQSTKINKYVKSLNNDLFSNPSCPKYMLYSSAFISYFVSDNLSELQKFYPTSDDAILENTKLIKQSTSNLEGEELCEESTFSEKSTYDKVCIYKYAGKKKNEFIYLYYNSTDSVIYERSTKNKIYTKDVQKDTWQNTKTEAYNGLPKQKATINLVYPTGEICSPVIYYQSVVGRGTEGPAIVDGHIYSFQKFEPYKKKVLFFKTSAVKVSVDKTYSILEGKEIFNSSTCEPVDKIDLGIHIGDINCDDLIGEKTRKQIRKILTYVKILVPILIIAMGIIDFSQAMFAGKEEEMKKAQTRFTKRLIIGVVIFLLPTIINLMLDITNDAWKKKNNDSACGLDIIEK